MDALPAAVDMERATLGAVLLNRDAFAPAVAILPDAADYYLEQHAHIWRAMLACWETRTPPDIRLVVEALRTAGMLEAAGGQAYLIELVDYAQASGHVLAYAQAVAAAATRRRAISAGSAIARLAWDEAQPLADLHAAAQSLLDAALVRGIRRSGATIREVVEGLIDAMDAGVIPGLPTGLRDLDALTGGLQRSDLVILAARPAVGKSSMAMTIAHNAATAGKRVDVYSLEMSRDQLVTRLIGMRTGIDVQRIRLGRANGSIERAAVCQALIELAELPIIIEDAGSLSIADVRSLVLRNASLHGTPDLIVIDYLQLMRGSGKTENRVQEVGQISRGLKALARELDRPVLVLSQLSRAVEGRAGHVPMLSDLRESGDIEADADIVIFIYRDELYNPESNKKGIAELHIAKHRNGPVGVVPLRFDASTTTFRDLSSRTPDAY